MPVVVMESDLLLIAGLVLVLVVCCGLGVRYWWNIRRNAPEAELFLRARKYLHPPPLMRIADTDGNGFLALGKVDQKGDVTFKFSEAGGVQVNPRTQGFVPEDKINGIPFYNYSTQFPFALGARNSQAFKAILKYSRDTFPEIKFLPDVRLLELVALPADQLLHDCTNVIETLEQCVDNSGKPETSYVPSIVNTLAVKLGLSDEEKQITTTEVVEAEKQKANGCERKITANELVDIVKKIQAESHILPISKGYFSYDWAFARIPSSILSQDIHQMKLLLKRQMSFDSMNEYQKYIPLGFAVLIITVGVAILFMLKPAMGH